MSDTPTSELITVERQGNAVVARITVKTPTDVDMTALGQKVDHAAKEPGVSTVAIDLTGVEMLPSLGLGALVQMANKCKARQQKLKLASCSPQLRQTFAVTRLDRFFDIIDKFEPGME
jgi:anti-sigma B factor antagonist